MASGTRTHRGRGFYLLAGSICAMVVAALVVCAAIGLVTLGASRDQTGEALDAAIMAYDLYLQEISNGDSLQEARDMLTADGLAAAAQDDGAWVQEVSERLRHVESQATYEDIRLFVYDLARDRLIGSLEGLRDARLDDAALAEVDFAGLAPRAQGRSISFMLPDKGLGVRMISIDGLAEGVALVRTSSMPELPGLQVLSPIANVAELYFVDRFGTVYAYTDRTTLEPMVAFEAFEGDGPEGIATLEYNGQRVRCYYHDTCPGYNKFVLLAVDTVYQAHTRFAGGILIASLVLVVAGCAVAFALSRHVYEPIQRIVERLDPGEGASRDELKLIGLAVAAMERRLSDQDDEIAGFHLMRLLHGLGDEGTPEGLPCGGADAVYALAIVRPEGEADMRVLTRSAEEFLLETGHRCACGVEGGFLFVAIDARGGGTAGLWERMAAALERRGAAMVSVFASDSHGGSDALAACYAEAMALLEQQTRRGAFHVVVGPADLAQRPSLRREGADILDDMTAYVRMNYCDPGLSTGQLAERFGLSQPGVSRLFKRRGAGGFLGFLHGLRIEHAQELLRTTNMSLGDIAQSSGYVSTVTMTRVFKRYTGVTPGEYRAAQRGEGE